MLFKNKKSNGSLKTLSENDIQKKLYGDYRPEGRFGAHAPKPEVKSAPSTAVNVATREETVRDPVKDLFTFPGIPSSEKSDPLPTVKETLIKDSKADQSRMNRLEQLAKAQHKAALPAQAKPAAKSTSSNSVKVGATLTAWGVLAGKAVIAFFQTLARVFAKFVVFLLGGLVRLVKWFDFSRPQVRRATFSVLGVVVLAFLFSSIHLLNVRREKAMKVSPPKMAAHKNAAKAKSIKDAAAADAAKRTAEAKGRASAVPEVAAGSPSAETPVSGAEALSSGESSTTKRYVIQVATYSSVSDADRIVTSLKDNQVPAFSKGLSRPSGKIYYAVFIGRFASFDDAQSRLEEFKKDDMAKSFQDAFIRTLD